MVTVDTIYNYDYRTNVVVINNNIENTRDMWMGDNDTRFESGCARYIKKELKL
jgi:hypothetical protein